MKTMTKNLILMALSSAVVSLTAMDAAALPVDNIQADGSTIWKVETIVTGGALFNFGGSLGSFGIDGGYVEGTLVHNGTFTGGGTPSFPTRNTGKSINGSAIMAQLEVQNVTGLFDCTGSTSSCSIALSFDVQVTFSGGVSCSTGWVNGVIVSSSNYVKNVGGFSGSSTTFTLPSFGATQCGGNGTTINTDFGLGSSSAFLSWRSGRIIDPAALYGS